MFKLIFVIIVSQSYLVIWDDPVAYKLENEDEETSVESKHPDLSPQLLHDWL